MLNLTEELGDINTMRQQSRYQVGNLLSEKAGVKIYTGLDPLTGLPVRCYEFLGSAVTDAELLISPHIPDILVSCTQETKVQVFTNHLSNYKIIQPPITVKQTEAFLLDTAQALSDAATLRIVHGGICPERFLFDGAQFYIEGYGVYWEKTEEFYYPDEQSLEADIYAWAISVKEVVGNNIPKQIDSIITSCLAKDPEERPNAKKLLEDLSSVYFYISDVDLDSSTVNTQMAEAVSPFSGEHPFIVEKKVLSSKLKAKPISKSKFNKSEDDLEEQEGKYETTNTDSDADLVEEIEKVEDLLDFVEEEITRDEKLSISTDPTPENLEISSPETDSLSEVEDDSLLLGPENSFEEPYQVDEDLPEPANGLNNDFNDESFKEDQDWAGSFLKNTTDSDKTTLSIDSKKSWLESLLEQKQQEAKVVKSLSEDIEIDEIDAQQAEEIDFEDNGLQMTNISGIYGTKERNKRSFPLSLILLLLGVLGATALTLYFFFSEQKNSLPVDIQVNIPPGIRYPIYPEFPADLHLVELLVIASPQGSSYPTDSILGTLTSSRQPIFLDKEGKWQLQARFEEHLSNILEVTVPLDNLQSGLEFEFQ